jgi:hypothetical protein
MPVGGFKRFFTEEVRELRDGAPADAVAMREISMLRPRLLNSPLTLRCRRLKSPLTLRRRPR